MKNKNIKFITSVLVVLLSISCGKKSDSNIKSPASVNTSRESLEPDGSDLTGLFKSTFITLNPHVNGTIPGGVTIRRIEDKLYFYVRLFAGGPQVWHQQNVYIGERCPGINDDTNGDGYIDIVEANAVLGEIVVPLDSDPGTQVSGKRFFPVSDLSGSYSYERIVSFNRFFRDLKDEDNDDSDNIIKIGQNDGFTFEGKAILIQGVVPTVVMPETVGSSSKLKPFQSLPIACGLFSKTDGVVGSTLETEIPGTIAPVEEGQDRPAPAGSGEYNPPGTEASRGTGNNRTNEGETTEENEDDDDI